MQPLGCLAPQSLSVGEADDSHLAVALIVEPATEEHSVGSRQPDFCLKGPAINDNFPILPCLAALPCLQCLGLPELDIPCNSGRREVSTVLGHNGLDDWAPEHGDHPVLLNLHDLPVHGSLHLSLLAHIGAHVRLQQGVRLHDVASVRAIVCSESLRHIAREAEECEHQRHSAHSL
jgi:hypothetical protein